MAALSPLSPFPEAMRVLVYNNASLVYTIKFAGNATYNIAPPAGYDCYTVSCEQNIYVTANGAAGPPANTGVNTAQPQSEINPGGSRVIANASANISFWTAVAGNASVAFYNSVIGP